MYRNHRQDRDGDGRKRFGEAAHSKLAAEESFGRCGHNVEKNNMEYLAETTADLANTRDLDVGIKSETKQFAVCF